MDGAYSACRISNFDMFIRIKKVKDSSGKIHEYKQLVESYRVGKKIKQQVVMTIGKRDESTTRVETIIQTLVKKNPTLELVRRFDQRSSDLKIHENRIYGSYTVFRHIWKMIGLDEAMKKIAGKKEQFEEMVFVMVLSRLHEPSSDRKMLKIFEPSIYHQLKNVPGLNVWYKAINRLQKKRKNIEDTVSGRVRSLFAEDWRLLYFDTTSLVLFGEYQKSDLVKYGYSKDKRNDKKQVMVGLVVSASRLPVGITEEVGNQSDIKSFVSMLNKMKTKYRAEKMIFVGDKGMNSKANREELKKLGEEYILGVRAQKEKIVAEAIRNISFDESEKLPFSQNQQKLLRKINATTGDASFQTKVVEMMIDGRKMVFMLNPFEKEAARRKREQVVAALNTKVSTMADVKKLIGNSAYRSFLKFPDAQKGELVSVDQEKLKQLEPFDGITVIESNTELPAIEIAKQYKQLITVEQSFSDLKTMLNSAPIYHKTDDNIRGHIFINFLALVLHSTLFHLLGDEIDQRNRYEIMDTMKKIQAHLVEQNGRKYWIRTELTPFYQNICSLLKLKPSPRILGV